MSEVGHIEFFDGSEVRRLSIGVHYGERLTDSSEDVVLSPDGKVIRHPYGHVPRESTEEERAAVGWTW